MRSTTTSSSEALTLQVHNFSYAALTVSRGKRESISICKPVGGCGLSNQFVRDSYSGKSRDIEEPTTILVHSASRKVRTMLVRSEGERQKHDKVTKSHVSQHSQVFMSN